MPWMIKVLNKWLIVCSTAFDILGNRHYNRKLSVEEHDFICSWGDKDQTKNENTGRESEGTIEICSKVQALIKN